MTLNELKIRRQELETNILQITQNLYVLHGHKAEVEFQISELEKDEAASTIQEDQPEVA